MTECALQLAGFIVRTILAVALTFRLPELRYRGSTEIDRSRAVGG